MQKGIIFMLSNFAVGLSDESILLIYFGLLKTQVCTLVWICACVCQLKNLIRKLLSFLYLTKQLHHPPRGPFLGKKKNRSNFLCNYRAQISSRPELKTYFISSADLVSGILSTSNLQKTSPWINFLHQCRFIYLLLFAVLLFVDTCSHL